MDRNFLGLLFLICMCGKVTIVDWVGEGVGEVVGICRKLYGLLILLCVCGKFTILLWGFGWLVGVGWMYLVGVGGMYWSILAV
jgi:hypothetical protein